MSDLKKLDEALATPQWPAERDADWHRAQDDIRYAARAYRNLLANGQRVEWCENHKASASNDGWFADELRCHVWWWGEAHPDVPLLDPYACRIVRGRFLIDPTEEVTGE